MLRVVPFVGCNYLLKVFIAAVEKKKVRKVVFKMIEKKLSFNQIFTAEDISEPLASVANNEYHEIKDYFENKNYDVIGYKEDDKVIGFLEKEMKHDLTNLQNTMKEFSISDLITNNTNLLDCLKLLKNNTRLFLINEYQIESIVTVSDIQKPAVRMFFFGIITFFEIELAELISASYPDDEWQSILKSDRTDFAMQRHQNLINKNQETNLINCTQLCDKTDVLYKSSKLLDEFVGKSKKESKRLFNSINGFRDALAHGQSLTVWFEDKNIIESIEELMIITKKIINRNNLSAVSV
ncbi:hypothetical protein [Sporosarcina jiandibaonis]|uniref:hypothetical protein n=1 Tax=Sporosarcina jiandibaonis TaxID=2715535 RepID=UPI001553F0D2|nr:hypothetical protein [Sporosarcina jiandibaonis]